MVLSTRLHRLVLLAASAALAGTGLLAAVPAASAAPLPQTAGVATWGPCRDRCDQVRWDEDCGCQVRWDTEHHCWDRWDDRRNCWTYWDVDRRYQQYWNDDCGCWQR